MVMTDKPKRQYFFSQEQKTKMAARKAIREKERELKKAYLINGKIKFYRCIKNLFNVH